MSRFTRWTLRAAGPSLGLATILATAATAHAQVDPEAHTLDGAVFSGGKLVGFAILFLLAGLGGNFMARDVLVFGEKKNLWLGAYVGGAVLALLLVLMLPVFAVGFFLAVVVITAPVGVYAWWRNSRVPAKARVFTPEYFRRLALHLMRREDMGDIAASRAVHVGEAAHLTEEYELLYMQMNDFPIHLKPESDQEQQAFARGEQALHHALTHHAETLYIVPQGQQFLARYRIDGEVVEGGKLDRELGEGVIRFFKKLAFIQTDEHRKPQHGQFVALLNDQGTNVSVQTAGTVKGEHLIAKLFPRQMLEMRLSEAGMRPEQIERLNRALQNPDGGIVLMSAPERSGRTVSMFASLREYDLFSKNVIAVEPEVSTEYPGINQVEVDKSAGQSLAEVVQNSLRSDPDVVMVEPAADTDTAGIMLLGAAAGKTVIGGVTAGDTVEAVENFIKLAGDRGSVGSTLLAVTNQRLMRKLCPACREAYRPNPEFLRKANLQAADVDVLYREPKQRPTDKKGETIVCPQCENAGYIGRTAVFEVVVLDDQTREELAAGKDFSELRTKLRKQDQPFMQEEALVKVVNGETSVSELLRILKPGR